MELHKLDTELLNDALTHLLNDEFQVSSFEPSIAFVINGLIDCLTTSVQCIMILVKRNVIYDSYIPKISFSLVSLEASNDEQYLLAA